MYLRGGFEELVLEPAVATVESPELWQLGASFVGGFFSGGALEFMIII